MSQWETILDKSSHISPVKINPPKNHSTERLEILMKSKSTTKARATSHESEASITSRRFPIRAIITSTLILVSLAYMTASIGCSINRSNSAHHPICRRVVQLQSPYELYNGAMNKNLIHNSKQRSRAWLHQKMDSCYEATEPYISKVKQGYRWTETTSVKSAFKLTSHVVKSLIYTDGEQLGPVRYINQLQSNYIKPVWNYIKDYIHKHMVQLRHQMDDYIESGSHELAYTNGAEEQGVSGGIVEDKLKRTAKRILDYIDQINEQSINTGMKQDEARLKAHEIIKSITDATTASNPAHINIIDINKDSSDVEKIAYEIQEIMEVAVLEKRQLDEQLDLIQAKLSSFAVTGNDDKNKDERDVHHFTIAALKSEIDNLRAIAENNVRQRAKASVTVAESINRSPSIKNRMKEDIQTAQRAALKDLRQVYVKLYQTNKLIDTLASQH
ncbi:adenine phosphoribosyltransferase [Mucor velutinosus]|uniref:Adenine phosphoribosyltransferase n=1 Tax=Mucor velutinosus TaxID=708070 RepID=A0AAN7I352_9FUNG|nr:adenine phosphoribosyltransferase [Mucor velutinosus]